MTQQVNGQYGHNGQTYSNSRPELTDEQSAICGYLMENGVGFDTVANFMLAAGKYDAVGEVANRLGHEILHTPLGEEVNLENADLDLDTLVGALYSTNGTHGQEVREVLEYASPKYGEAWADFQSGV